jgi:hypothetical protein
VERYHLDFEYQPIVGVGSLDRKAGAVTRQTTTGSPNLRCSSFEQNAFVKKTPSRPLKN